MMRSYFARLGALTALMTVAALYCACFGPPDWSLERNFSQHREEFDRLLKMFDEDEYLTRVAPKFVRTATGTWPDRKGWAPIPAERWKEYKYLFSMCSLANGIERGSKPGEVFFLAWSYGLMDRGSDGGFLYCGPAAMRDTPETGCTQHIEKGTPERRLRFRPLADDWYIFQSDPR